MNDVELAKDIVQEAFAKVWESPRTPREAVGFKRWLYRSIANLAKDHHRRQKHAERWDRRLCPAGDTDDFERWMSAEVVFQGLKRLPLRDRQLVYLRYFEDLPLSDCARLLGMHPVSIRVRIRRALGRLERELPKHEFFPEVAGNER